MSKVEISRPTGTDGKGILGSDNITSINDLEKIALNNLDKDKLPHQESDPGANKAPSFGVL